MVESKGLPGFRDFYPDDYAARAHVVSAWREVARRYGFQEYDGPPLEPLELYTKKSGDEIVEQLYQFEDKGGRSVALRPEMTPTLARMVGSRARALPKPIRWFSVPQLFRYERQQRGRLREHFQLNMDILGDEDVLADADLLAAAIDVTRYLGLGPEQVRARVSDRKLLASLLARIGVFEDRLTPVFQVIDRLEREPRERQHERLGGIGLGDAQIEEIFALTAMKDLDELRASYGGAEEVAARLEEMKRFVDHLHALGVGEFIDFDMSIVRGLAYYTGIIFELWDARRELRAICGGGRYDDLLSTLAGVDMPATGFGMGDVVLTELLNAHGLLPDVASQVDCHIVSVGEASRAAGLELAGTLRAAGYATSFDYGAKRPKGQFKSADQLGARWAIVVGSEEVAGRQARIKDMRTGEERVVSSSELVAALRGATG